MLHVEATTVVILVVQVQASLGIKFPAQSFYITNLEGTLVAKIPVQGISDKKHSLKVKTFENGVLFTTPSADGCNSRNLRNPKSFADTYWRKSTNGVNEFILLVNTLNCDLPTKIQNAVSAGYTVVLLHNTVTNANPSSVVLQASDVSSNSRVIKIFFVGQKFGRLLIDLFAFPKRFKVQVYAYPGEFYLTRDDDDLDGNIPINVHQVKASSGDLSQGQGSKSISRSWKIRTQVELEEVLKMKLGFPSLIAFFTAMILWLLQNTLIWASVLTSGSGVLLYAFGFIAVLQKIPVPSAPRNPRRRQNRAVEQRQIPLNEIQWQEVLERIIRLSQRQQLLEQQQNLQAVPPLPQYVIDTLAEYYLSFQEAVKLGICLTCRNEFIEDYEVRRVTQLSCAHVFHSDCVREWFNRSGNCPTCRAVISRNRNIEID